MTSERTSERTRERPSGGTPARAWRSGGRSTTLKIALLVALGALLLPAAYAGAGRHPHFNDQGTLPWYRTLAQAKAAARAEGKVIFVEYGRLRCPQCRVVVQTILPNSSVRGRVAQAAVGLASDCDNPEHEVEALFRRHLANAGILPYCAFLTAEGRWITGFSGSCGVGGFQGHLASAETHLVRCRASCAPVEQRPKAVPDCTPKAPQRRAAPKPRAPAPVSTEPPAPEVEEEGVPESPAPPLALEAPASPAPAPPAPAAAPVAPAPGPTVLLEAPPALAKGAGDGGSDVRTPPRASSRKERAPEAEPGPAADPPPSRPVARPFAGVPEARLVGSPDGEARAALGMGSREGRAPPTASLPRPTVRVAPPSAASRRRTAAAPPPETAPARSPSPVVGSSLVLKSERAAADKRWGDVLRLHREALTAGDGAAAVRIAPLAERARAWADERLAAAVRDAESRRYGEALAKVRVVRSEIGEDALAFDAGRGEAALHTLEDLEHLDPRGRVFATVWKNAAEEARGTRWHVLFR